MDIKMKKNYLKKLQSMKILQQLVDITIQDVLILMDIMKQEKN